MVELKKKIKINDNRILIYTISEGYVKPTYTISEGFIENGELKKTYSLGQWDDYGFNGWTIDNKKTDKISFEFEINHPLYFPLIHLLNYDYELIIDDDDTRENNKKYLSIYKKENKIVIEFINSLNNTIDNPSEKFHVFIKNIIFDGRSKIDADSKDTKKRLLAFFKEVHKVLITEYHQISFEEYFLKNLTNIEYEEIKKYFKKTKF